MSHPYAEHHNNKVERDRVSRMTKGYASGGAVHDDAAADMAMIKSTVKKSALKMDGGKSKHRGDRKARASGGGVDGERNAKIAKFVDADKDALRDKMGGKPALGLKQRRTGYEVQDEMRGQMERAKDIEDAVLPRARGGRAKHKGTHVNIMIGGQPGNSAPPMPIPVPAAAPAVRPHPAMAGPVPGAAVPPGAPLPMAGIRRHGGRAYASGGAVSGPGWKESERLKTKVQHADGKDDQKDIGRGKPITYKTGGAVEHPRKGAMAPHLPGGAGGGLARIRKQKMVRSNGMAP